MLDRHNITAPVRLQKRENRFVSVFKRISKNKVAVIGFVVVLIMIAVAIAAPLIAPYSYETMDFAVKNQTPSWAHICGTDEYGRDIFSRLLYGARYSLSLGLLAQVLHLVFGVLFGSIAGYYGGKIDAVIMRICDTIQSIPNMLLAVIVSSALGVGFINTVIALGIGHITTTARVVRAQFLPLRSKEFVEAEKSINCSNIRIIFKHILPNAFAPVIVQTTMGVGGDITTAAALSFLGLGVRPPTPEWGAMLSSAKDFIRYYPHMILFPGLCIAIVVLSLNLFGDGLRDALDPKLKT